MADQPDWSTPFKARPRDPERIDAILAQLGKIWHQHPDFRLTQRLLALLDPRPNVLFYVEDTVLEERLREFAETGRWPASTSPD